MNWKTLKIAVLIAGALASGSCGILKKGKPKTPVVGERIDVLATESDVTVDPTTAALPMTLPAAEVNASWAQSGGNASKAMGQVALPASINQAWAISIGRGTNVDARLGA